MKIRKAKLNDSPDLSYLQSLLMKQHAKYDKYWETKRESKRMFEDFVKKMIKSPNAAVFLAEDEGKIVGYVLGKIEKRPPIFKIGKVGHITDAFVLKGYRKQGIARDLINEMLKWYKNKNINIVEIEVELRNSIGSAFWKKMGFRGYLIRKKKS